MARRPPTFTNPYQVKPDDKDFLTLAANLGVDMGQLRAANPYVHSISQGQWLNVPNPVNFNFNADQYGQQLQQGFSQAGLIGTQNALGNIGVDIAKQGLSTAGQIGKYGADLAGQAWQGYKDLYGSVPQSAINTLAPFAPGLAYSFLAAKQQGTKSGRNVSHSNSDPFGPRAVSYDDYAQRAGVGNLNLEAAIQQWQTSHTLPPDLEPNIIAQLVDMGADPALIQKAMQKGTQQAAAATDPLKGTPGHHYVDEKTAPLVGQLITREDGSRRYLLADKNGRLYYGRQRINRRSRENRRRNALARAQAQVIPTVENRDGPVTALNVIMGS